MAETQSFEIVTEEAFPHGLRCSNCERPIEVGQPLASRVIGIYDDGSEQCVLTCVYCPAPEKEEEMDMTEEFMWRSTAEGQAVTGEQATQEIADGLKFFTGPCPTTWSLEGSGATHVCMSEDPYHTTDHVCRCGSRQKTWSQKPPMSSVEWGVFYEDADVTEPIEGVNAEAVARALVAESPTDRGLRKRMVTNWEEVD